MRFSIDLHNHSCLSPCADDDFYPSILAIEAKDRGIDIVALTDHNSTENLIAFREACDLVGITGVYGMEITTIEEVHLLSLFETVEAALEFSQVITDSLIQIENKARLFGHQYIVNVNCEVTGEVDYLLYGPSTFSFDDLVARILSYGGLAVPAHIDRPSNSALANLGFLPPASYSAIEMIHPTRTYLDGPYPVIQGSDAHTLNQVGRRRTIIEGKKPDFSTLRSALEAHDVFYLT